MHQSTRTDITVTTIVGLTTESLTDTKMQSLAIVSVLMALASTTHAYISVDVRVLGNLIKKPVRVCFEDSTTQVEIQDVTTYIEIENMTLYVEIDNATLVAKIDKSETEVEVA